MWRNGKKPEFKVEPQEIDDASILGDEGLGREGSSPMSTGNLLSAKAISESTTPSALAKILSMEVVFPPIAAMGFVASGVFLLAIFNWSIE